MRQTRSKTHTAVKSKDEMWADRTLVPSECNDSLEKSNIDETHLPNFLEGGEDEEKPVEM
jgi:hypothetical protein